MSVDDDLVGGALALSVNNDLSADLTSALSVDNNLSRWARATLSVDDDFV